MLAYNFGSHHPMNPLRLDLTARLLNLVGLFDLPQVTREIPDVADDASLLTVHDADYVQAVKDADADPDSADGAVGIGTDDTPAFPGMHSASARMVGGSLAAAEAVLSGSAQHAVNFGGGLHHAGRARAGGFCIYNDAAAAIQRLLDGGVQRVLYLDVDAHHGDGTQEIFWDDKRVMTISLHETGMSLFPGTGFPDELGGPSAFGFAVNLALPTITSDSGFLRAFHAVVPQLATAFQPEVIVSQHGCDSHRDDPLTNLRFTVDAQYAAAVAIRDLASSLCEGRWIATGGGGYNITSVVPRSWTLLTAVAAGTDITPSSPVPEPWRAYVKEHFGSTAPYVFGDGSDTWWQSWEAGFDPNENLDRAIMATRKAVFPLHGLDPWFD
ncbi:acetoin utilization protein AcuC [Arthrobacter sp. JZ12]|uniref:acetoin utilization protein AcuC n=1 Tax=Arthrobacter sp. JZ12 TaxID=2654190 RepID=UPI002B48DC95|nr:acetoin utilization protein AcuC [Arthrobacter sp. JZ12]WRH26533.1 acetoin utilization protein AcuC [Arthrobacter sp. JZ12]